MYAVDEQRLRNTADPQVWAEELAGLVDAKHPTVDADLLLGWFANYADAHRSHVLAEQRGQARRFYLYRHEDVTGVSGAGEVADGVEFADGAVVLRWRGDWPTSIVWHDRGIESVERVHCHGGKTSIIWLDQPFVRNGPAVTVDTSGDSGTLPTTVTSCGCIDTPDELVASPVRLSLSAIVSTALDALCELPAMTALNTRAQVGEFVGHVGDMIQITEPRSTAVRLDKFAAVCFAVTAADLSLPIEEFRTRFIDQAVADLAARIVAGIAEWRAAAGDAEPLLVTGALALPPGALNAAVAFHRGLSLRVIYSYNLAGSIEECSLDLVYGCTAAEVAPPVPGAGE